MYAKCYFQNGSKGKWLLALALNPIHKCSLEIIWMWTIKLNCDSKTNYGGTAPVEWSRASFIGEGGLWFKSRCRLQIFQLSLKIENFSLFILSLFSSFSWQGPNQHGNECGWGKPYTSPTWLRKLVWLT